MTASPWQAAVAECTLCGRVQHVTYCATVDDPDRLECSACQNPTARVIEHRGPDGERLAEAAA